MDVLNKISLDFFLPLIGHRMNPDEFMNIKQVTVLLKRTAMSGPYECSSNRNVNALGLSEILTTLKPVFIL